MKAKRAVKRPLLHNWFLYASVMAVVVTAAWVYGERLLYLALVVLAAMPAVSYAMAYILLRLLHVSQTVPKTIVKNEGGFIALNLHNVTPVFFGNIRCIIYKDDFAVEAETGTAVWLKALETAEQKIPFHVKYRGVYRVGLQSVHAVDMMGLFRLKRKVNKEVDINVLPRIVEMTNFPLAMNLLTQAHSRFDIKDEDYATISDIRPYLPTDSIKRVHWKLTAKRNEWLVKNFQSNALNKVTMVLDSYQLPIRPKEQIVIEDRIIETAMGLARFCLRKGMPVDFLVGEGPAARCRHPAEFETIYQIGSRLVFTPRPLYNPLSMLTQCLNDASGYLNVLIITARLDGELYERIVNGTNNGHYVAVLYFATVITDYDSEQVFRLLNEGGLPCFRITEGSFAEEGGGNV